MIIDNYTLNSSRLGALIAMKDKLAKLSELEKKSRAGGGEKRIQQQHDKAGR